MRCPEPKNRLVLLICLLSMGWQSGLRAETQEDRSLGLLKRQYQDLYDSFAEQMQTLADFCEEQSFFTDAEAIRIRAEPVDKNVFDLDALPVQVLPELPVTMPPLERQWRVKLRKLEEDFSNDLYLLARRAINAGHATFAFRLVREAAFHNPDHKFARKLLGYVSDDDHWSTPFAKLQKQRKYVDHPLFGWILEKYVPRYEQGERLFNGRWMSAEKEANLRQNFRYAWVVETEHFEVTTNHSLEKGVEIGRALEVFHKFFIREFAAFFDSPQQMVRLFNNGVGYRAPKRYRVFYYKSQQEFITALQPREPRIGIINGLYMPNDKIAYFFHPEGEDTNFETMVHEVTHQLLSESTATGIDNLGEAANFWLVEGFASYMESFKIALNGSTSVGDPKHIRIYWAKQIVDAENFFVPLQKFTSLGKNEFQGAPTAVLSKYYSQGSGLTYFLLHYQDGLYRDEFIEHMSLVYSSHRRIRDNPPTLEELTGVSFQTLDQQYLDFVKSLPE